MKQFIVIVCLLLLVIMLVLINNNIKFTQIVENFSNSSCKAVSKSKLPKNHPVNLRCRSGPHVTNLLETKEDGTKIHRCKSKCAVKSDLGYTCCEPVCCSDPNDNSSDKKDKAASDILDKSVENLEKIHDIGNDLVENSGDKLAITTAERDAKLLKANDGRKILDPTAFSYKPEIKLDHKQPSIKIASAYGWSFMPPQFWSVPQKRPPACIPSEKNTATVMPIYDKSTPIDSLEWTKVGSILPKHEYTEVHNPNYYYPGWIAQDSSNDPFNNAKKISKTGKYYNMNRAVSTKVDMYDEVSNQKKNKINVEDTKKQTEEKNMNINSKQTDVVRENNKTILTLDIPNDLRDYVRNEKYLSENIKSLEDYSKTKIDINHNYDKIIIVGRKENITKVTDLLDKSGSGTLDAPSWKL